MKNKRKYDIIVLIDHEFKNAGDPRVVRTAGIMSENNFKVCIIAYVLEGLPQYEAINNIEIFRLISRDYSRPRSFFHTRNSTAKIIANDFSASFIICNDHRMLDLGYRIKKLIPEIKIIYDAHEYLQGYQPQYDETNTFFYKIKSKLFQGREKKLEKNNIRHISLLCTINDSFVSLYKSNFIFNAPAITIRNISEFSSTGGVFRNIYPEIYNKLETIKGKPNIIYFGNFFPKLNGIECLFSAMKLIPDDISLILVGLNKDPNYFNQYFNNPEIKSRLLHIDRLPHSFLKDIAEYAMVSVIPTMATEFLQTTYSLPNKIFDSIAAELPIICTNLVEHRKIIEQNKNGVLYTGSDWENAPMEIADAFAKITLQYKEFKDNAVKCKPYFNIRTEYSELVTFLNNNTGNEKNN